jgi:hypothetical protein
MDIEICLQPGTDLPSPSCTSLSKPLATNLLIPIIIGSEPMGQSENTLGIDPTNLICLEEF